MAASIYTKSAFIFVAKVGGGIYRCYVSIVLFLFQTICLVVGEMKNKDFLSQLIVIIQDGYQYAKPNVQYKL